MARSVPGAPTEICLTFDTEFNVGGAFADPDGRQPIGEEWVDCPADGQNHGLPFILDALARHGLTATFFVEALNTAYFGDRPMGRVVERILAAGMDVQLHLHPCWIAFAEADWKQTVREATPNDDCTRMGADRYARLISFGLSKLDRWGVAAPLALRTGNLQVSDSVYRAMEMAGLSLSSNIGLAVYRPRDPALQLASGRHMIHGILELPVLTYDEISLGRWRRERLFAITATSHREAVSLLWAARNAGVSPVVILSHPSEFIKHEDGRDLRPNPINKARLEQLCGFVAEHPDDFVAQSFSGGAAHWLDEAEMAPARLRVPPTAMFLRVVENGINDLV